MIYVASKTKHAEIWKDLRRLGAPIISTWIDNLYPKDMQDLWVRCIREASTAKALVLYCEPGDVLKGGFLEAGAALACGVPVFAVGCEAYSFTNHPGVVQCSNLPLAVALAKQACKPSDG